LQGLFGDPQLKNAASFGEVNKRVRAECAEIVRQIESGSNERTTVQLFDDLSNTICKAADLVECVRQLHSDPKYTIEAQKSAIDYCELVESLNTFTALYHLLKNSKEKEASRLDEIDKRTIDLFLNEFEQSGVHLPDAERAEFVRLSGEIFKVSTEFQTGCDQEEEHLRKLVCYRDELARLTGYESYAHRAQENTLLGSYERVHDFLWGVIQACRPAAERELAVLMDVLSQCSFPHSELGEWDVHYLTQIYKERAYGPDHCRSMDSYLTLGNLLSGFANLVNKLYGVRLEERPLENGEMWRGNIIKLDAFDGGDRFLGTIYLDIERRETKAVGDCHFTVRCSKLLRGDVWQTPIVVLSLAICDSADMNWKSISVDFHRAENVFHEMGHAMHSMLGRTRYQHVAGTRCPQDFSEIPSILMEYFFNDLTASYALFDLELHGPDAAKLIRENRLTTTSLFHSIITKALPNLKRQPDSAFQHRDSPFNRSEGDKWMKVQSYGGGLPPAVLLERMLGYSLTSVHLVDALKRETSHLANLGAVNV
uniref:Mitochondrial intermediate peptidase (inferred by orthology to a human protein) n=1 Tax=Nippostrongylus brasiliensis TaxID=27835 RepID=A0A158R069_NIPBR